MHMILRFGDTIFDLKYAEKIALDAYLLKIRFANGKEDVIDLREYGYNPDVLIEIVYKNKDRPIKLYIPKRKVHDSMS
jgi:hypothetical protein